MDRYRERLRENRRRRWVRMEREEAMLDRYESLYDAFRASIRDELALYVRRRQRVLPVPRQRTAARARWAIWALGVRVSRSPSSASYIGS